MNAVAQPVSRTPTLVGGYPLNTEGMPQKQSGESGATIVPGVADDARAEAKRLLHEVLRDLSSALEDLDDHRDIVAAERVKTVVERAKGARVYVEHLARKLRTPYRCPRCQTATTHDKTGECFCATCTSATYGKARL